jgi:hypothetical protein
VIPIAPGRNPRHIESFSSTDGLAPGAARSPISRVGRGTVCHVRCVERPRLACACGALMPQAIGACNSVQFGHKISQEPAAFFDCERSVCIARWRSLALVYVALTSALLGDRRCARRCRTVLRTRSGPPFQRGGLTVWQWKVLSKLAATQRRWRGAPPEEAIVPACGGCGAPKTQPPAPSTGARCIG